MGTFDYLCLYFEEIHHEDTEKNISSTTGGWTQEAVENGGEMITFNEQGYNKYNL